MKKTYTAALIFAMAVFCLSCRELSRNNPYDPASPDYINITYKAEAWYPGSTSITAMAFSGGFIYLGGHQAGTGDCVIKLTGPTTATAVAVTPLGAFSNITDICADLSGNIYITDDKQSVQKMDASGNFTDFPIANMASSGGLHIEWAANSVFISNPADKKIYKYSDAGVQAVPDSKTLSSTASGYFTPGSIFAIGPYIYVINSIRKNEVVRLAQDLSDAGTYLFERDVMDCAETAGAAELLSQQAVFRVDSGLAVALKWGDYGEGPGKLINGKMATYDPSGRLIYILDGGSIKIFGE